MISFALLVKELKGRKILECHRWRRRSLSHRRQHQTESAVEGEFIGGEETHAHNRHTGRGGGRERDTGLLRLKNPLSS